MFVSCLVHEQLKDAVRTVRGCRHPNLKGTLTLSSVFPSTSPTSRATRGALVAPPNSSIVLPPRGIAHRRRATTALRMTAKMNLST